MTHRTFHTTEYRNGRFGVQSAWIARAADGYLVGNGWSDPIFIPNPAAAKAYYRRVVDVVQELAA